MRDAVLGGGGSGGSGGSEELQVAVKSILREFLTRAPLESPGASRGRRALTFLCVGGENDEGDEDDEGDENDGKETTAATTRAVGSKGTAEGGGDDGVGSGQRLESLWRDLLIDWVQALLLGTHGNDNDRGAGGGALALKGASLRASSSPRGGPGGLLGGEDVSAAAFVARLVAASVRMRRVHEIAATLPPAAKQLDRRAFSSAFARLPGEAACRVVQRLAVRAHALLDGGRPDGDVLGGGGGWGGPGGGSARKACLDALAALVGALQCAQDLKPFHLVKRTSTWFAPSTYKLACAPHQNASAHAHAHNVACTYAH
jgi:hypothetical protein